MKEIQRLIKAFGYSFAGLRGAVRHPAFLVELIVACVMIPLAFFLARHAAVRGILIGSVMLVLIVELLNSAIEETVNRISTEWHERSKIAKDLGSAAVLLSIINAGLIWSCVLWGRI